MSAIMQTKRRTLRVFAAFLLFFFFLFCPLLSYTAERRERPVAGGFRWYYEPRLQSRVALVAANQTPSSVAQDATLADFAWLEGRWRGDWGPRSAEQIWTAPKGGLILGTFRLVEDNKTLLVEVYTLLQKPQGIELRFRHFTPDLASWETSSATLLTLESFDAKRFVFANALNGEPKHAIFTRVNLDTYTSRSEIVPTSGEMQVVEITYHRQKPPRS